MGIILKRTDKSLPEYKKIKNLYKTAFPADERAPFWLLMRRRNRDGVDFWAVYDENRGKENTSSEWVGMAYVISYNKLSYVFYLAIDKSMRGKGFGSAVLHALKEKYVGQNVFLAIERIEESAPNYDERVKRKHFYMNNGFVELNCLLREAKVVYEVMGTTNDAVPPEEYKHMMRDYLGAILSRMIKVGISEKRV